jgi:hypothetical protein
MTTSKSSVPSVLSVAAFAIAWFALAPSAMALDCGSRLVVEGDSAAYVLSTCGEPASVTRRTESREAFAVEHRPGGVIGESARVTVEIEVWVYDFGPRRFMHELTFENGILRSARTIGRGTRRPAE